MDGIEVLKRLRSRGQATPVLILNARDTVTDRVTGLDSGANDYISKPFELLELEARIRALLRKEQWGNMTKIVVGGLEFDTVERRATINGDNLDLSARELRLMDQLNALTYRNGYLESKLEEREKEVQLLTDSQHKRGWWARFASWFVTGR